MNFQFFNRPALGKIIGGLSDEAEKPARLAVEGILRDLPDLLLVYVAEVSSGRVLVSCASHRDYNPNKISLRNAKLFAPSEKTLTTHPGLGGPLLDVMVVLDEQLHHLRPFNDGKWYCFVAIPAADANLGVLKEITRRHTSAP